MLAVDQNLRHAMTSFSLVSASGEVRVLAGVQLVSSGIECSVFNTAFLSEPLHNTGELERRLAIAQVHFAARRLPWSFWICEDLLGDSARGVYRDILPRRGLRLLSDAPGMIADELLPPIRTLQPVECVPVSDERTRGDFARITSFCFDLPMELARRIYECSRFWMGDMSGYVAYVDGEPVSTMAVVVAAGAVGVYSVATLPMWQGKGCAEALMREVLSRKQQETGIARSILQSTAAGASLYKRLGYRNVTRFAVFVST
ncbi:MAG: GNAT family N-acetyltransferase [Bryobacteraceae bacterium]|nr:GNAT family N-acetyltransferase [Bryobacterales bacterium]MEB2361917.1 GNAT family N-acetyltransferase [Bryobacterales bacterium]NUN01952.1 GNAT family N-acetyltransferase [Bryobacteraceae bacterium]